MNYVNVYSFVTIVPWRNKIVLLYQKCPVFSLQTILTFLLLKNKQTKNLYFDFLNNNFFSLYFQAPSFQLTVLYNLRISLLNCNLLLLIFELYLFLFWNFI